MAELLDLATRLIQIDISNQVSSIRKVQVKIDYAVTERMVKEIAEIKRAKDLD